MYFSGGGVHAVVLSEYVRPYVSFYSMFIDEPLSVSLSVAITI